MVSGMDFVTWLAADDSCANTSSHIESGSHREDFESWFSTNGGYIHPSIELGSSPLGGNSFHVKPERTISPGSTIVSCPHSLALSWPSAQKFHYPDIQLPACTQHVATRFFLMKQKLLEERSPWWPYVRMLPENFNTPPYYSPEDFAWLRGTNLGRASELRECDWRGEFDEMMKALLLKGIPDEKKRLWTW